MGNAKQALSVIINNLGDIEEVPNVLLMRKRIFFQQIASVVPLGLFLSLYCEVWGDNDECYGCVQAVEFVNMQHDDELWEELIQQCLHKPEMVFVLPLLQI